MPRGGREKEKKEKREEGKKERGKTGRMSFLEGKMREKKMKYLTLVTIRQSSQYLKGY